MKRPENAPLLEIQIHPASIRQRVRYFFLSRRQVGWGAAITAAILVFGLFNLAVAPRVASDLMSRRDYRTFVAERGRQGDRLKGLIGRLSELGERSEELHMIMSRIYMAYGLESDQSEGQGGFPFEAPPVPHSIYSGLIRQGSDLAADIGEQMRVLETFVGEVQSFESAHGDQVKTTPSTSPIREGAFVLTSPFGNRRSPFTKQLDFHAGIDLAAPVGTPIHAPADGVVVFAGRYPLKQSVSWWRYGNLVALRNGDRFITLYGHCDEIKVRSGQKVAQGELLATVGNTGWSTSPHLHYEVRWRGADGEFEPVDPRIYILDHRWRDEERLLVRARLAPEQRHFEPLPRIIGR